MRRLAACTLLSRSQPTRRALPHARPNPRCLAQLVLGIETSCDDTAAAVVSSDGRVLGEAIASQGALHAPHGGVVPQLAANAHAAAVDAVVAEALARAGVSESQLGGVAVTLGPGLAMCLRVGVVKARAVAAAAGCPLVAVHHMEAHALVARLWALQPAAGAAPLAYPFVALLVSGGHSLLVLTRGVGQHTLLGTALDDAAGEAFDKTARLLRLDLAGAGGGGGALEACAARGDPSRFPFAVPLRATRSAHRTSCDLSFAGLKTAARLRVEAELGGAFGAETAASLVLSDSALGAAAAQTRSDVAAAFQVAAVTHLSERTKRALAWARGLEPGVSTLVLAGGVARNAALRSALGAAAAEAGFQVLVPPLSWCTDNGAMVAWAGVERLALGLGQPVQSASPDGHVELRPRWPLGEKHPDAAAAARSMRSVRLGSPLTAEALVA